MAKIAYNGREYRAKAHRLISIKPAYNFQILYHVKTKDIELMQWRGEYSEGHYTAFIDVPKAEFPVWLKRIDTDIAKPELKPTSDWTKNSALPADAALHYHQKLEREKKRQPAR